MRKTVVGFANSLQEGQTAVMFVGADNNGQHKGLPNPDEAQINVNNILQRCYPPIPYRLSVLSVTVEGQTKQILAAVVSHSPNRPHFAGPAYVRQGSETKEASQEMFLELIASQNDKARRILQFKGKKMWLRLQSKSGFWYDLECDVRSCDAHSVTLRDNESRLWSFPITAIEIRQTPMRDLEVIAPPPCTEEEHIRDIVQRWAAYRKPPNPAEYDLRPDWLVSQLLANPALVLPAVAALADGSPDLWLRLLLLHLRFAIKKTQEPLTPQQKLIRLHEVHQKVLGKHSQRGLIHSGPRFVDEVNVVLELATSIDEAHKFLEQVIHRNRPEDQQQQRRWLAEKLGLPLLANP